ncbi:acyl-CoA dehydrogenase N-terminal domain-containing protein [Pseudomonas sp. 2FE]|uniref:acyl-CoA dehydrogenase N-terminal domain-containing protein n=1 Tax=Pseudomonas sp. 2FE TaxID=2502190 RepID=UPI0010FA1F74
MSYQAPLRDMRFVLHKLFDVSAHCELHGAPFYTRRILPRVSSHREALQGGADCLMAMPEAHFAF